MTNSNQTTSGWIVFLAAMGMLFGLMGIDLVAIRDGWASIPTPMFIGTQLGHIAVVIAAFIGGKLIPIERDPHARERSEDIIKLAKDVDDKQ